MRWLWLAMLGWHCHCQPCFNILHGFYLYFTNYIMNYYCLSYVRCCWALVDWRHSICCVIWYTDVNSREFNFSIREQKFPGSRRELEPSANRRRQVADVDVIKNKICRRWRRCGGRRTAAASNDVKTGRRQQLTRQLITARVQVIASTLSHTHSPRTSKVTTLVWQTCIRSTIARPPTSSTAAALKGCSARPPRRRAGRLDRRGDTAESPEGRGGGGSSRVKVRWLLSCVRAPHTPASITTQWTRRRPPLRG